MLVRRAKDALRLAKLRWLPMSHVSEELVIFRSLFSGCRGGVLLDVGAHYGHSLTPFALSGWEVHAFEPDQENRRKLDERCKHWSKVAIDPRAVSEVDGERLPFFTSSLSTGISTLHAFHDSHKQTYSVYTVRLSTYCAERSITKVDFLKIDVEGLDLAVLKSHDWSIRPRVVMCEFEDRKTVPLGHASKDIVSFLEAVGYIVIVSEWCPVVQYGGDHRWRRAFKAKESEIPSESWGNLIAVSSGEQAQALLRSFEGI